MVGGSRFSSAKGNIMDKPLKFREPLAEEDILNIRRLAALSEENVGNLEQEIRENPRTIIDEPEPVIEPAKQAKQANDIGRLSANAVQAQYEVTVKAVDDMGLAVQDRIRKLEHDLKELHKDMTLLAEVAATIRNKVSS
jgi:hypothetical protein